MLNYLIRRLLWAGVLFVGVTLITYVLFFLLPADPARLAAGKSATAEDVARVSHQLGLDRPVHEQYALFLKRLVVDHSLGRSYANRRTVNEMVGQAIPVTAALVLGGAILWMLIALPIGILSALRPRSLLDRGAMIFILIGISAPVVWIGLLLQYFVGFKWGLTPNAGYCDVFDPPAGSTCGGPSDWAYHMILPWLTFAILFAASYARMIRANVLDTLGEDYVRTARAKGAPENVVIRRHVLRNALLPVVTMLGLDIGVALGGAIFTEAIFNLPGLGRLALNSVLNLDLPTMQGVVVFATLAIILLNLVVDVVYAYIDRGSGSRERRDAGDRRRLERAAARRARPAHVLQDGRRHRQGRRRGLVRRAPRADARGRGRVRLGEERHDDVDPQPQPEAGARVARHRSAVGAADGGVPAGVEEVHVGLDGPGALPRREPPPGVAEAPARPPGQRDLDDLPGPDDVAQPGALDREPARRGRRSSTATSRGARPANLRSRGCRRSGSRGPSSGSTTTRTSSPAGCASA